MMKTKVFSKNQHVFQHQQPSQSIYLLRKGTAQLVTQSCAQPGDQPNSLLQRSCTAP